MSNSDYLIDTTRNIVNELNIYKDKKLALDERVD
jgi:hypothetical protein